MELDPNLPLALTVQADISEVDKDDVFKKEFSLKSDLIRYSVDYNFIAKHQDLDRDSIISTLSLIDKIGQRLRNIKTTTISMPLSASEKEEDEVVLLGSLVSRVEKGLYIPETDFERGPLFPDRKRGRDEPEEEEEEEDDEGGAKLQPV